MKRIFLILFLITLVVISSVSGEDCLIKGNINSKGQKLYHLPGWPSYNSTKIDTDAGERWFCTEEEAIAAGWSPAVTTTPKPTSTPKPTKTPKPTPTPKPTATPLPYTIIGDHVYDMKPSYGVFTREQADFLTLFRFRKNINDIHWDEDIFPLGTTVENFIRRLIEEEYIREPTQQEKIEIIFGSYNMIAEELRSRGLSSNGSKNDMIQRLIESDPNITEPYPWINDIYYPTDKSTVLIDEFTADLQKARSNAVMDALDYLIIEESDDVPVTLVKRLSELEKERAEIAQSIRSESDPDAMDRILAEADRIRLAIIEVLKNEKSTTDELRNALSLFVQSVTIYPDRRILIRHTLPGMVPVGSTSSGKVTAPPEGVEPPTS